MGITLPASPPEEGLPSRCFYLLEGESVDGPQVWAVGGVLVSFSPSAPPRAPSKTRKVIRPWALVCSAPRMSFWPKETPMGKRAGLLLEIIIFRAQVKLDATYSAWQAALSPSQRRGRSLAFPHSDYLSIKNLPTQLSPDKALLRRETSDVLPPVLFTWSCDLPPRINISLTPYSPFHPGSKVTMDPGLKHRFLLPPLHTYGAAQTIWFLHWRSNPGHSYSHSAPGLYKNPSEPPRAHTPPTHTSQHRQWPTTQPLCS